jgi:ACT domain-containing protein
METDLITVTFYSGTGDATVTVVAEQNTGEASSLLNVVGRSMIRTVTINQEMGYGTYHFLDDDTDFCQWLS